MKRWYTRFIGLILAAVMLLGMLPQISMTAAAAENQTGDIAAAVEQQIRAFADSIDQKAADGAAATALAMHGISGKGKKLTMDASNALTAVLLNSELVQEGMAIMIADIIESVQRLDMNPFPQVDMDFGWYGKNSDYGAYILTDTGEKPENLDWMVTSEKYTGKLNSYDNSLEWMVGNCNAYTVIECIKNSNSEKTYRLTITFEDRFDFSTANNAGFKKLLSAIGMRLFREFDWSCTITMEITAPYSYAHCSHGFGVYHWIYDGENRTMTSDGSGIYTLNKTTHRSKTAKDGKVNHYYELDNTIRLDHNKPWILEYETRTPVKIVFAPVDNAVTKTHPQITQSARTSIFAISKDYAMALNTDGNLDRFYAYNYHGTKLQELFPFAYNKTYTFRLENEISADGRNQVYLTATEKETGASCLERIPMDNHYYFGGWMDSTSLVTEESDWLNGRDIHINYFGTGITGFDADTFELRIWENGKDNPTGSYWAESYCAPTCTAGGYTTRSCDKCGIIEQINPELALGHNYESLITVSTCTESGYTTYTCSACGYEYHTDYTAAQGHRFGDWHTTTVATCTAKGQEQRECATCGDRETRESTALGHSYGEWYVSAEPTCTVKGEERRDCSTCGHSETREIAAKGHRYADTVTLPTCMEQGYQTHTCTVCGDSYADSYVDALGHTEAIEAAVAPTCTETGLTEGKHCSVCSETLVAQEVVAATGHSYESIVTAPACTAQGYTTYTCNCGDSYKDNHTPVKGHNYVKGTCTACGDKQLAVTAPKLTSSSVESSGKIKLSWNRVDGAVKYKVYRATSRNGTYKRVITTTKTSITNTSIEAGKRYYYYVTAVDANDNESEKSNIINRVCDLAQPKIKVSNVSSSGKIKISWEKVAGAVKYEVWRATSRNGKYTRISTTKNTSITNTSTTAGKTYYYKVRAICSNTAGTSAYSEVKSRTCDLAQPKLSITRSSGKPKLSWGKVSGAVSYKIYRATSKNGTYSLVKTTTSCSWKDTSARKNRTYYYKVVAVCSNSSGNSAYSNIKSIKATK